MRTWFALLAAPVLALADQAIAYAAAIAAGQRWRATALAPAGEAGARRHFLAGIATGTATLSALVILAMWIPAWLLSPCFS